MTLLPEHLSLWQPEASPQKLRDFVAQNATLLTLLQETWQKFDAHYHEHAPALPTTTREYAPDMLPELLTHSPISQQEMIDFLNQFDREREHNDRPFGNHVPITEQNWEIIDD